MAFFLNSYNNPMLLTLKNNKANNPKIITYLALCFFLFSMITRPTILGGDIAFIGSGCLFLCGILLAPQISSPFIYKTPQFLCASTLIIFWTYMFLITVVQGMVNHYALSALVQLTASAAACTICLSHKDVHDKFFTIFRGYLILCALSYFITTLFSFAVGTNALAFLRFSAGGFDGAYYLYFPLTFVYGPPQSVFGFELLRLSAGFREAGIAQAFFATAILYSPKPKGIKDFIFLGLLVFGGLGTLSTIGFVLVPAALVYRFLTFPDISIAKRLILFFLIVALSIFPVQAALNDSTIGLSNKKTYSSYWDRKQQVDDGLKDFVEHPFGTGYYSEISSGGINMIASLGQMGVLGLFLFLIHITTTVLTSENRIQKAIFITPLLITAIFSQPLLDAQLVYIFYSFVAPKKKSAKPDQKIKQPLYDLKAKSI